MTAANTYDHVILLHGLGRTWCSMLGLQFMLRRAGYRVTNIGYPSRHMEVAQVVREYLEPALARLEITDDARVHFVTHSLGGIVFRRWAATRDFSFPLGRTIMLAPPNQGSDILDAIGTRPWVRSILGPAVDELRSGLPGSPSNLGPVPPGTAVIMGNKAKIPLFRHLFQGESDGIVSVNKGQVEGMEAFRVVAADHTFIMWQPKVWRMVRGFLRLGLPGLNQVEASADFVTTEHHEGS